MKQSAAAGRERRTVGRRTVLTVGAALVADLSLGCRRTTGEAAPAASTTKAPAPGWASGGTAAMRDRTRYPDPFAADGAGATPARCTMTCQLTEGPCYSSQSEERADLSYGEPGLPMQLALRILDESCAPVKGALVDVWHVSPAGKYSGHDEEHEDVGFCTGDDAVYASKLWFRGKQRTDARGVVVFDTCFPGWYHGRTVHVHLTISTDTKTSVTTQLCFDDALSDEIFASQPLYGGRGERDAKNGSDGVFGAKSYGDYLASTSRMTDGAMLATKTILLRSSSSEALCEGGGGGFGGPRGPGGPGGPFGPGHHPPPGFDPSHPPPRHGHPPHGPPPAGPPTP